MDVTAQPEALEAFVGRASEVTDLLGALRRARSGRGTCIVVSGEAGIGKTRLAEEAGRQGIAFGLEVLWGRCSTDEGAPPFWPWAQVARTIALSRGEQEVRSYPGVAELDRILSNLGGEDDFVSLLPPERARFQLMDGITTFFVAAARRRPLLIVLDDLHWADDGTLDLAAFMAQQVPTSPVVLILTVRELDARGSERIADLLRELPTDVLRLRLGGLDESSTATIVAEVTGVAPAEDAAAAIHQQTAGNPFFVREVSKLLVSQGRLHDLASGRSLPVPAAVRDVLDKRFARLSQGANELLAAASILGIAFDPQVLQVVAREQGEGFDELIDEALSARVLVHDEKPGRYRFAHALMRDALYENLPTSARRAHHLRAAETLDASGARPTEIFHHLVGSLPDAPTAKAVAFAERAGKESLAVFAYRDAAAVFQQALDLLPGEEMRSRGRLLLLLAEAESRFGDRDAAAAHYRTTMDLSRRLGETELLARAALGLAGGPGGFEVQTLDDDATRILEDALGALSEKRSALRPWVAARLSVALTYTDQQARRRTLAREAVGLAADLGDPAAQAYALSAYCDTIAGPAHAHERIDVANRMIETATAAGDPELELLARRFRLVALGELGRYEEFDRELERFERVSDGLKQPISAWYVPLWRAMRAHMLGRYEECERLLAEAERIGVHEAKSDNAFMLVFSLRWPLLHELGRIAEMNQTVAEIHRSYGAVPATAVIVGLHNAWMGRPAAAEAALQQLTETGLVAFPKDTIWLGTMSLLVLLAREVDDARLTAEVAQQLAAHAGMYALDGIAAAFFGSVHHWLGTIACMTGKDDEAATHFEKALRAHARVGAVVWLAHTRREYGELLKRGSDPKEQERGRDLVAKAEDSYWQIGVQEPFISTKYSLPRSSEAPAGNRFRRKGNFWEIRYSGREALLKDTKGMGDLATLLAHPGVEFNVLDLLGAPRDAAIPDDVLDRKARDDLTRRAAELKDEIEDATAAGDPERAAVLREELEFIARELASASGLGGRRRHMADPAERARKTVTSRIRDSLGRIEAEHPALGRHLRNAIKTGLFCSYQPEAPVRWEIG